MVVDVDVDVDVDGSRDAASRRWPLWRPSTTSTTATTTTSTTTSTWVVLLAVAACSVSSPATEVREALARAAPLELADARVPVTLTRASFGDVVVAAEGRRARVLAVVDADGRVKLQGREIALGYVGREAFEMERCATARWCPAGPLLPALEGVVAALAAAPHEPGRRPVAWQVRVERDRATVGEDAEGPDGARAPRGLVELVRDGAGWRLAGPR